MKTLHERDKIADEIIRRCDTVTLLTVKEVRDIRNKARQGDYDDIFEKEKK
jgi:hypothetical protein